MKVAYLLNSISRKAGGLFEICRRLVQTICREKEIVILGVKDEFTNADINEWAPLRPAVFPPILPRSFGYAAGYAQYLAERCPDIAHVHGLWTYPSLAGYLWHRRTKRPLMYTAHGMLDPWALRNAAWKKRLVRGLWEDAAHRSAACFHVNSEAEHISVRRFGLRNPICVIPNGVDLPDVGQQTTEHRPLTIGIGQLTSGRRVLLYLGRLHPKKNLANLIRAWKATLNSQPPTINSWVLAIAGWDQGGHERELKQLAKELGLSFAEIGSQISEIRNGGTSSVSLKAVAADTAATTGLTSNLRSLTSVVFLGPLFGEKKAAAYRSCDVFVLPSLSEGLPMTVLEAWAYAKPVLMTPECNLPEGFAAGAALQIGTTSSKIAAGLKQLTEMTDDDRKAMGARGRTLVAEKFSWPRIGQQLCTVYEWMLGGGTPPETVRTWGK
jgi:glycosyltransferase involved in cell wall biosynthesis